MTGGLLIGYARVSADGQGLQNQLELFKIDGFSRILAEKFSGAKRQRPELDRLLDHLCPDDVVVVTRLDHLARSARDLLEIVEGFQRAGAGLRSLSEPWADTTSAAGLTVMTIFAGIAEFERSLIIERTNSGRESARSRGVKFGSPAALSAAQIEHARELIATKSVTEAAQLLDVHRSTLYRALERASS